MKKRLIAIMLSTALIGGIGATIGSQTAEASTLKEKNTNKHSVKKLFIFLFTPKRLK